MQIHRHRNTSIALIHPHRDGVPAALRDTAAAKEMPQLMARIARAKTALVHLQDAGAGKYDTSRGCAVILGPHGLVGYISRIADGREIVSRTGVAELIGRTFRAPRDPSTDSGYYGSAPRITGDAALRAASRALALAFLKTLDPEILSALRFARQLDSKAYNWVSINKERRVAALRSYAWLAEEMIDRQEIAVTIDVGGGSLEESLAEVACWSRRSLKRISRRPACLKKLVKRIAHVGACYRSGFSLDHSLSETPDHLLPATVAQWRDWATCWSAALAIRTDLPTSVTTRIFVETYGRKDWRAALDAAIARRHAGDPNPGASDDPTDTDEEDALDQATATAKRLCVAVRDVEDAIDHILANVFVPAAIGTGEGARRIIGRNASVRKDARIALYMTIAGNGGLAPLLQMSSEWHRRGDRDQRLSTAERERLPDETRVGTILAKPLVLHGLTYTPMTTAGEIRAEAKAMNNCLGGYVDRALVGKILVFHVSGTWKRKKIEASMTLRPGEKAKGFAVDDIRDAKDRRFPNGDEIARLLADHVKSHEITVDAEAARKLNMTRGLEGMFDMPELGAERAESSWESWCYLLPKRLRTRTVWEAMEGPFFEVGRLLCLKGWMIEKRKYRKALADARRKSQAAQRQHRLLAA